MHDFITAFWNELYREFTYEGITFCLMDVFCASIICGLIGNFIGNVLFFFDQKF